MAAVRVLLIGLAATLGGPKHAGAAGANQQGMVLIPAGEYVVGTTPEERVKLAKRFACHPTWLNDDLPRARAKLAAFWIDTRPVTNAEYLAFCKATKRRGPKWWKDGANFPVEYAHHPVVGVNGVDARAYADFVGKRLPTPKEWEAAVSAARPGARQAKIFPWGDAWPGPLKGRRVETPVWSLPATLPVGGDQRGTATNGLTDFAGQALEWTARLIPHHTVQFQLLKGASWFHESPESFRTAAGIYAHESWTPSLTGLRCALDGNRAPPSVPNARPHPAPPLAELAHPPGGPLTITPQNGRQLLTIRTPALGPGWANVFAPESLSWNRQEVLDFKSTPPVAWTQVSPTHATYSLKFEEFTFAAAFIAGKDTVEQLFTVTNHTDKPGTLKTSTCFNLQNQPSFYDSELKRTYVLTGDGKLVPSRRFSRRRQCVRWITSMAPEELGPNVSAALLGVRSRDGRYIIGSGRGSGHDFRVANNTCFTCLHTDSATDVPAKGQATSRQLLYFLEGDPTTLLERFRADFGP